MNLGRQPLQIVEIDIAFCDLTYGNAPCTAVLGTSSVRKCFNTFATCADRPNIDLGTLTLRFAKNQAGLPKGQTIYPALQSVSTNPTRITLGATDDRIGTLGKRARVTVSLKDFRDSDNQTDKYADERRDGTGQTDEGGYEPGERGTFFAKLRNRFPYYNGRALRVRNGYVGDDIATMPTRHYVITEWRGPNASGDVSIVAQDILDFADRDKALCPAPSRGVLAVNIAEDYLGDVDLEPATIGDTYDASGRAAIGSEIVSFTRSGDTITLTGRGLDGSSASGHDAGDTFQQAYRVENAELHDVARDLFVNFANIPASWIDLTDWETEVQSWFAGSRLTRTVAKPTSVTTLVGQLADFGFLFWSDELAQRIRLRANRPVNIGETVTPLSDDTAVIEGTLQNKDLYDQRISQVLFYHGIIDMAGSDTDAENYSRLQASVDLQAEGPLEYNLPRVKEIYSPWLGNDGNDGMALAAAGRLLVRFRDTPIEVTFTADIKNKDELEIADLIDLTTRVIENDVGLPVETRLQVTSSEEIDSGNRLRISAQSYRYDGRFGFIMANGSPDYSAASETQRNEGCFITDNPDDAFGDGTEPYVIF